MRRYIWLSVGLLIGIGCGSSTEPLADVHVATTVAPRNSLPTPVTITTTVTNDATHAITIETNPCPARFRIETLTGVRIGLSGQICAAFSRRVTLAPGQLFSFHDQWDGRDSNGVRVSGTSRVIGQPFLDHGPQSAPVTVQFPE